MVERFEYFYRVGYCNIDDQPCKLDGACDMCHWAKINKQWEALNAQKNLNTLEPTKKGGPDEN